MTPLRMLLTMCRKNRSSNANGCGAAARDRPGADKAGRARDPPVGRLGMGGMSVSSAANFKQCARVTGWLQR
jgi:hypothetical protein